VTSHAYRLVGRIRFREDDSAPRRAFLGKNSRSRPAIGGVLALKVGPLRSNAEIKSFPQFATYQNCGPKLDEDYDGLLYKTKRMKMGNGSKQVTGFYCLDRDFLFLQPRRIDQLFMRLVRDWRLRPRRETWFEFKGRQVVLMVRNHIYSLMSRTLFPPFPELPVCHVDTSRFRCLLTVFKS